MSTCPLCQGPHALSACPRWKATDAQLVVMAQAGDNAAFGELYKRYNARVMAVIRRYVGDEVEDIAQEVFLQAFVELPRFRGEAKFYTWLIAIAKNAGRLVLRYPERRPLNSVDPSDVDVLQRERASGPLDELEADRELERIDAALRRLPDGYREPLMMRELGLMTEAQIADAMGLPVSTIKARLHKAQKAMGLARRLINLDGEAMTVQEASRRTGISDRTLHDRLRRGIAGRALFEGRKALGLREVA